MSVVVALLAAVVTAWLALQMAGAVFKVVFLVAAVAVAWTAVRSLKYS